MSNYVDFWFRMWLPPVECDDAPRIEVWVHELEIERDGYRPARDWILEHMEGFCDLRDELLFDIELEPNKAYQVIGTGKLRGFYSYDGEYEEEMDVNDLECTEWNWNMEATGDE